MNLPLIVTPPGVKGALEGLGGEVDRLAGRCRELEDALRGWTADHDDDGPCGCSLCAALGSVPVSDGDDA